MALAIGCRLARGDARDGLPVPAMAKRPPWERGRACPHEAVSAHYHGTGKPPASPVPPTGQASNWYPPRRAAAHHTGGPPGFFRGVALPTPPAVQNGERVACPLP